MKKSLLIGMIVGGAMAWAITDKCGKTLKKGKKAIKDKIEEIF